MHRVLSKRAHGQFDDLQFKINSIPLDLTIFKQPKAYCMSFPDNIPITERCSVTERLCTAALYLNALKTSNDIDENTRRALFVEFNEVFYDKKVIDDITHFIKEHDRHIDRVQSEWTQKYGHPTCRVSECAQTRRHYGRGRRGRQKEPDKDKEDDDDLYYFYESLYDRIHFFIFHLFDVGMRVDVDSLNINEEGDDEKEKESEGVTVDEVFAAEREHIMWRRKELKMDSERISPLNTKFTIQTVNEQQGITLTDALFEELRKREMVQRQNLQQIQAFLNQNAFDSDAMDMDLENITSSNLYTLIQSQSVVETMKTFIGSINLRRAAFSTGFEFKYSVYNDVGVLIDWIPDEQHIKPKYKNLKEEILESGYLSHSKWMQFVDLKGRKYWNESERVKKVKEDGGTGGESWRIKHDLSLEHLFVIILYCDFTTLCNAFSKTFRRENVFESVKSVVSRHSEFAHFGKLLVEMVEGFGISRVRGNGAQRGESGPFHCGIDRVLHFGTFAITLRGPTSTSIVEAVAVNFAKSKGMILKLNNDSHSAKTQKFFDCSWISNYFEEQERVWIAGYNPLRIVSIVLIQSAKSYRKAMKALYLFDAMISGVNMEDHEKEHDPSDYEAISALIQWTLNGGDIGISELDWFIKNEWNLFLENKKKIDLDMVYLDKYYQSLSELVVFQLMNNWDKSVNGTDNLLKSEWISMFPSVDTLSIDTGAYDEDGNKLIYKFRLESLLKVMQSNSSLITVNVIDYGQWIESELTDDIATAFGAAGWNIEYKKKRAMFDVNGDILVINRLDVNS